MFIRFPSEREWVSWLYVLLCVAAIFATIPIARRMQEYVAARLGRETFTVVVVSATILATAAALSYLRKTGATAINYLWLLLIAVLFVGYTFSLRQHPEEALHFVEYGILAVLVYRALCHRIQDPSVYVGAVLLCLIVGVVDEGIQWATPGRYWGIGDIWLNGLAATLVMAGIALGLRPPIIKTYPTWQGIHLSCRLALVALVLLGASLLNTPARIAWYSHHIPFLESLRTNESVMWEYGFMYSDPEIGIFRSRLAPKVLQHSDRARGAEAARILDNYKDRRAYLEFLTIYTPVSDPFLHEARVHLFRRNRLHQRAMKTDSRDAKTDFSNEAHLENRILEKYFPHTLSLSSYTWNRSQRESVQENLPSSPTRIDSYVSRQVVTSVGESHIAVLFSLLIVCVGSFCWYSKRKMDRHPQTVADGQ